MTMISFQAKGGQSCADTSLTANPDGNRRVKVTCAVVRIYRCHACGEIGHSKRTCVRPASAVPVVTLPKIKGERKPRQIPAWKLLRAATVLPDATVARVRQLAFKL